MEIQDFCENRFLWEFIYCELCKKLDSNTFLGELVYTKNAHPSFRLFPLLYKHL